MRRNLYRVSCTLLLSFFLFTFQNTLAQNRICADEAWVDAGHGLPTDLGFSAQHFVEHDSSLYLIARIRVGASLNEHVILRKDSTGWTTVDTFFFDSWGYIYEAESFDGDIYLAGSFWGIDSVPNTNHLAKWNGSEILSVAEVLPDTSWGYAHIRALEVYNNELYLGGFFDTIAGVVVGNLAIYDGTNFRSLPSGMADSFGIVPSLHAFNGDLYMGVNVRYGVLKWDGTSLSKLVDTIEGTVDVFAEYDGKLVCNAFNVSSWPGGVTSENIAYWDGTQWLALPTNPDRTIWARKMLSHGNTLYVQHHQNMFWEQGELLSSLIVKFDGSKWDVTSDFELDSVQTMISYDGDLYVGGWGLVTSCGNPINHVAVLCDSSECVPVTGYIYQDDDLDCEMDASEFGLGDQWLRINDNAWVKTKPDGLYKIHSRTDSLSLKASTPIYRTDHCGDSISMLVRDDTVNRVDFGFRVDKQVHDMEVYGSRVGLLRPGRKFRYSFNYNNLGTTVESGVVSLTYDSNVSLDSTSVQYDSVQGRKVYFSYSNLKFWSEQRIYCYFTVDSTVELGDTLYFDSEVDLVNGEIDSSNNWYLDTIIAIASYDPNDISVRPGVDGEVHYETEKLIYKIRFQNTGNDTAFDIRITDRIPVYLDISSLRVIGSSHDYSAYMNSLNYLTFRFDDIMLPDSNVNEAESHGYITFEMDITDTAGLGTIIYNSASIFFDYNHPIFTNIAEVELVLGDTTNSFTTTNNSKVQLFPNPSDDLINFDLGKQIKGALKVYTLDGRLAYSQRINDRFLKVSVSDFNNGLYFYSIVGEKVNEAGRFVVQH